MIALSRSSCPWTSTSVIGGPSVSPTAARAAGTSCSQRNLCQFGALFRPWSPGNTVVTHIVISHFNCSVTLNMGCFWRLLESCNSQKQQLGADGTVLLFQLFLGCCIISCKLLSPIQRTDYYIQQSMWCIAKIFEGPSSSKWLFLPRENIERGVSYGSNLHEEPKGKCDSSDVLPIIFCTWSCA